MGGGGFTIDLTRLLVIPVYGTEEIRNQFMMMI